MSSSKWEIDPGGLQLLPGIEALPARDPEQSLSPEGYQALVDTVADPDRRHLCQRALDGEDWTSLNDMLTDEDTKFA